jgi:serine/threonine protein kinase
MPTAPPSARDIFLAAIEQPTPKERAALVTATCQHDPNLKREVEALLAAHEQPDSRLDRPAHAGRPLADTSAAFPSETVGMSVGPYKLRELLGEGGMGIVYVAEQEQPIRRKVALQIIKPGMDSRGVLGRFSAERQALALMDHPHIAKVLDAGATAGGRPYFVMELVRGVPITNFCDQRQLSVAERLDLFIGVCHAIQHAHQKGRYPS